jgi:hypothetical protein
MNAELVGKRGVLVVSDPWEFGTENGTGPFPFEIVRVGDPAKPDERDSVLIRLLEPIRFRSTTWEFFAASPRHVGASIADLSAGRDIGWNLTGIPADRLASPFDLSWWRGGGAALIGTLRLAS